jgi:serine/threonine protein kinase
LNAKLESEGLEPISNIVSEPQLGSVANAPVEMKSEEASGPGVNPWAVVGILIGVLVVTLPCIIIAVRKVVKRGPFDHLRIVDDIPDYMPGERIDPDKVVFGASLGRGTSGEVVRGTYTTNGRTIEVAIKIMPSGCTGDDLNKFAQEVQTLLTASSRCNGTVKCYGICLKSPGQGLDPRLCIIMKRYKMTLAQIIRESGHGLSTKQVAKYTRQLIHTIADLHDAGIVHQDLKPDNLFVDDDDNLVVADFGISKIVNTLTPAATTTLGARGTQNYMSPEAFFPRKFGQVAHKTDIWSVGACVLEMCTGLAPFAELDLTDAEIAMELNAQSPIAIPENSPFTLVLRRCFTFDQTERRKRGGDCKRPKRQRQEVPSTRPFYA